MENKIFKCTFLCHIKQIFTSLKCLENRDKRELENYYYYERTIKWNSKEKQKILLTKMKKIYIKYPIVTEKSYLYFTNSVFLNEIAVNDTIIILFLISYDMIFPSLTDFIQTSIITLTIYFYHFSIYLQVFHIWKAKTR